MADLTKYTDEELEAIARQDELSSMSDEELASIAGSNGSTGGGMLGKIGQATKKTEQLISQRPSMIADLIKDPTTFSRFAKHPLGTTLRTVGGALEYTQGIPASIGLAMQRGRLLDIPKDVMGTLTGQRPAQAGDIARAIGVPEPISAGIGLLADANKFSPSTGVSNAVIGGAGKLAQLPKLAEKFGAPLVAKTISFLTEIPEEKALTAIKNPNFLKPQWLKKEGVAVQSSYKKVIQPLIDDSKNTVDTSSIGNLSEDVGLLNKSGDWTKVWRSMKPAERVKIDRWEKEISKGKLSFNDVDGIIGEIDTAKKQVYQKLAAGKDVDRSDDFIRVATEIRKKLNALRKTQFPEAGKVLDRYEQWKAGESIYKHFNRMLPHMMPALVLGGMGGLASLGARNPIYGASILAAIPKVNALGIRAGYFAGRNALRSGSMLSEIAFEQWRKNR